MSNDFQICSIIPNDFETSYVCVKFPCLRNPTLNMNEYFPFDIRYVHISSSWFFLFQLITSLLLTFIVHKYTTTSTLKNLKNANIYLQRTPKHIIKHGKHFEQALATQIIMLAPMAPHYASELWSKFCSTPNRLNPESRELQWNEDVLSQHWPSVDLQYKLDFTVRVSVLNR